MASMALLILFFSLCGSLLFPSGKNHFGRHANWRPTDEFHTEVELVHPTLPVVASGSGSLVHLQLSAEVHTCGGQKETARTQKRQRSWLQEQTGTNVWHHGAGQTNRRRLHGGTATWPSRRRPDRRIAPSR